MTSFLPNFIIIFGVLVTKGWFFSFSLHIFSPVVRSFSISTSESIFFRSELMKLPLSSSSYPKIMQKTHVRIQFSSVFFSTLFFDSPDAHKVGVTQRLVDSTPPITPFFFFWRNLTFLAKKGKMYFLQTSIDAYVMVQKFHRTSKPIIRYLAQSAEFWAKSDFSRSNYGVYAWE